MENSIPIAEVSGRWNWSKLLRVNSAIGRRIYPRLQELSAYYSNRLSYEEVES